MDKDERSTLLFAVAYHGTAADNVWSILQLGLRSRSGTQDEKNGNLFGNGIYLSGDPRVAYSFAGAASSIGTNVLLGSGRLDAEEIAIFAANSSTTVTQCAEVQDHAAVKSDHLCVFVAEVISLPENVAPHRGTRTSQRETDEAAYYVVPDPSHVRLSRLLVYSSQHIAAAGRSPSAAAAEPVEPAASARSAPMRAQGHDHPPQREATRRTTPDNDTNHDSRGPADHPRPVRPHQRGGVLQQAQLLAIVVICVLVAVVLFAMVSKHSGI